MVISSVLDTRPETDFSSVSIPLPSVIQSPKRFASIGAPTTVITAVCGAITACRAGPGRAGPGRGRGELTQSLTNCFIGAFCRKGSKLSLSAERARGWDHKLKGLREEKFNLHTASCQKSLPEGLLGCQDDTSERKGANYVTALNKHISV